MSDDSAILSERHGHVAVLTINGLFTLAIYKPHVLHHALSLASASVDG